MVCLFSLSAAAEGLPAYGGSRAEILENIGFQADVVYDVGSTGEVVRFIQTALGELGLYEGAVTGQYDDAVAAAISRARVECPAVNYCDDTPVECEGMCDQNTLYMLIDMYLEQYEDPAEVVEWNDVLAALGSGSVFSSGKTVAKLEGGKVMVSGGTLANVKLDERLPEGTHTVAFDDVIIHTTVEILAKDGETLKVFFDKDTAVRKGKGVEAEALRGGRVEIVLEGSATEIEARTEEGGEVSVVNRGVLYESINVCGSGNMSAVNEGDMQGGLVANMDPNGCAEITNRQRIKPSGRIFVWTESGNRVTVNNDCIAREVDLVSAGDSCVELVNNGTIWRIAATASGESRLLLKNHGEILNNIIYKERSGNEEYLWLRADDTARIEYSGNGVVKPGYTVDGLLGDNRGDKKPTVAVGVHMMMSEPYSSRKEARAAAIEAYRRNINLPLDGLQAHEGLDQMALIVHYGRFEGDEEGDRFIVRQAELYGHGTDDTVVGEDALEKLPKTGDTSLPVALLLLAMAASVGCLDLLAKRRVN